MYGVSGDGVPGLAEKMDRLFTTMQAPTKSGRYSNDTAAAALAERGVIVSGVHLSHLRSGRRDNPSARLLAALSELFEVPYDYFFGGELADQVTSDLELLAAIRDERVRRLLVRTRGVSETNLDHLLAILDHTRRIEGLDPDPS